MFEPIYKSEIYPADMPLKIESLGRRAVSIANRWELGWPEDVKSLISENRFLWALLSQARTEVNVLAGSNIRHLSELEILALHDLPLSPRGI